MMTTGILLLVFATLWLAHSLQRWLHRRHKKYPPSPKPCLPAIGHMACLAPYHKNPWEGFAALKRRLGDAYLLQMGVRKILVVSSFDIMKEVLLTKGEIFVNRPDFYRYHVIFGGDRENALALCDWSKTQRLRRIVAQMVVIPRFGSQLFQQLNSVISNHVDEFVEMKRNEIQRSNHHSTIVTKSDVLFLCANIFSHYLCSKRFEFGDAGYAKAIFNYDYIFWDIIQSYAWDFIPWLTTYFGIGSNYLKTLSDACIDVRNYMGENVINPRLKRYMEEHGLDEETIASYANECAINAKNSKTVESSTDVEINEDEMLKTRVEKDMTGKDFLDVSLEHHFQFKDKYPWEVAVFEVLDLIGGHSAVGNLLMRALGHLALYPNAQEIVYREGQRAIATSNKGTTNPPNNQQIINLIHRPDMPFTESVIFETLRLASSPIIPHVASKDTTLAGFDVDEGTMILFNTYYLNMSSDYWKNPESFDPTRFLVTKRNIKMTTSTSVNNNESGCSSDSGNDSDCDTDVGARPSTDEPSMDNFSDIENWKLLKPEYFMPFSFGRRACLGYKLVSSCCFCVIANLCQEFILSPVDNDEDVVRGDNESEKQMRNQLFPNGNLALPVDIDGKCFQVKLTLRRRR